MTLATKLRRSFLWACALAAGLPLLAYLFLLAINWRDEPPTTAAIEFSRLYQERPVPTPQNNAYFYLMGFTAPSGEDPVTLGTQRIEWMNSALTQPWNEELAEPERKRFIDYQAMRLQSVNTLVEQCRQNHRQCTAGLEANPDLIEIWLKSEEFLLGRYLGLLQRKSMYEPFPYEIRFSFPEYQHVLEGQCLLLVKAWQLSGQGELHLVKRLLEEDLAFWRMALADADVLITKMVAASAIKQHFFWANRVLGQIPAERMDQAIPKIWHKPLTMRERSMLRSYAGELVFASNLLAEIKAGSSDDFPGENLGQKTLVALSTPFILPQMSTNQYAELLLKLDQSFTLPYERIEESIAQATSLQRAYRPEHFDLSMLRNLGTNLLLMTAEGANYQEFSTRVADLEGLRRAALLIITLHSQGIPTEAVPAQLENSELLNPYTQAPFAWDAEATAVTFPSPGREEVYILEY